MQTEIIISGFGGQGVLFAGQLLAYAALDQGMHVTWFPSYGPEMRGGTAHCTVILSDEEIGAPAVRHPKAVLVLNIPSLEKYENLVQEGGVLVINTSLMDRSPTRAGIEIVEIRATEIAEEIGNKRLANIVMIGALLKALPILSLADLADSLEKHLPERHYKLLEPNLEALEMGYQTAAGSLVGV
jgi:2-oxoglutarate ferredoxin oxidoreductase subunit gamma